MKLKDVPEGSAERRFWRAIEIAAHGELEKDIADVGRYVASRGEVAVAEFGVELLKAVAALRGAGVAEALRRGTTTTDGRALAELSDAEMDHVLESLVVGGGNRYFQILLKDPEREAGGGRLPMVDLLGAVEAARAEPGIEATPLWQEKRGDRRRDGSLWIELSQGLGVGLDWNSPPWTTTGLSTRFQKAAVIRSLDDSWRAWRSGIGAKRLDVWLEYWLPGDEAERVAVTETGSTTAVTVHRNIDRLKAQGDPVQLAEQEAETVFNEIRTSLPPH